MRPAIDVLDRIVASKRARLMEAKRTSPEAEVKHRAFEVRSNSQHHALRRALAENNGINVIAEIKRASPSKGSFGMARSADQLARAYSRGGAAAISVLTEEDYFHGTLTDLTVVRDAVSLPLLRKDFLFDEYQIYESAAAGADALLLIAALLDDKQLSNLRAVVENDFAMDALIEVHTRDEMRRAFECGATVIGVNNRNLHTFEVSLEVSLELARHARRGAQLISESGLTSATQLRQLGAAGYSGFLIGEALVRAENPEESLRSIIAESIQAPER